MPPPIKLSGANDDTFKGADLPKAAKLNMVASSGTLSPNVGAIVPYSDTGEVFNYGPFTRFYTGGVRTGWYVQEPGVYELWAMTTMTGVGGIGFQAEILINAGIPAGGYLRGNFADAGGAYVTAGLVNGIMELKAGDAVTHVVTSPSAYAILGGGGPPGAGYTYLAIEKKRY